MWDIAGKACGQPSTTCLAASAREKIRVYRPTAGRWRGDLTFPLREALMIEEGFTRCSGIPFPTRARLHRQRIRARVHRWPSHHGRERGRANIYLLSSVHRRLARATAKFLSRGSSPSSSIAVLVRRARSRLQPGRDGRGSEQDQPPIMPARSCTQDRVPEVFERRAADTPESGLSTSAHPGLRRSPRWRAISWRCRAQLQHDDARSVRDGRTPPPPSELPDSTE